MLDPALHGDLIVERVLARGDRRELRWLFGRYGRDRIAAWVRQSRARVMRNGNRMSHLRV